jgi:hypothetical protein
LVATADGGIWITESQIEGMQEPEELLDIGTQLGI